MQLLMKAVQAVCFFGTIWFFTEIAPNDAPLGAKAFMGVVVAYLATCALMAIRYLMTRGKQRIYNIGKTSGFSDLLGRRAN